MSLLRKTIGEMFFHWALRVMPNGLNEQYAMARAVRLYFSILEGIEH